MRLFQFPVGQVSALATGEMRHFLSAPPSPFVQRIGKNLISAQSASVFPETRTCDLEGTPTLARNLFVTLAYQEFILLVHVAHLPNQRQKSFRSD